MAKHSKGPFYIGHLGSDQTCQCATICNDTYAGGIATVHFNNGKPVSEGGNDAPPREEAIANMHLFAAAPDLLAAAQLGLVAANRLIKIALYRPDDIKKALKALQPIYVAIAKAEGREVENV